MKKQKKHIVPTDQDYTDNLNLVTGAKFNYDKQLPSDAEIKELCIDQKKSKEEKFMKIIQDGEKIQKWSVLENLNYYCQSNLQGKPTQGKTLIEKILEILIKNYSQLTDYISIMGDGISNIITNPKITLSQQAIFFIFELGHRTLTTNPSRIEEWETVFEKIASRLNNQSIQKSLGYIQGAFEMNSPPEKLLQVKYFMDENRQYSDKIFSQAYTKVLFFNSDQNFKTRMTISKIIMKLLTKKSNDEELWKIVWDYFHDREDCVKRKAIEILFSYQHVPNFKKILDFIFTQDGSEGIVIEFLPFFAQNFSQTVESDKKSKLQIIAFCNRVINSKKNQNICLLLSKLKSSILPLLGEVRLFSDINFNALRLRHSEILESYLEVYDCIESVQFKDNFKTHLFKALRQSKFEVFHKLDKLGKILDLCQEQEIIIYLATCNSLLDNCKWTQLQVFLQSFQGAKLFQTLYDKFCSFFLKALLLCPKFMLSTLTTCIIYLLILNRRSLQFFITIRQKLMTSKTWSHRSTYIILYTSIKAQTSFEYHKLIPTFLHKSMLNEKNYGVRMTYLSQSPLIYKYTEPQNTALKATIKDTVIKLQDDKDKYVREVAFKAKKQIQLIDKELHHLQELYRRNEGLYENQQGTLQVQTDPKRVIKTQNDIRKSLFKKKMINENRRTTNTIRENSLIYKDMSIDSLGTVVRKKTPYLDFHKEKKPNLFRCHSVKMKAPSTKKKQK